MSEVFLDISKSVLENLTAREAMKKFLGVWLLGNSRRRVTRLGEFLPIVLLFTFAVFRKLQN
jgi:hypothetical protein